MVYDFFDTGLIGVLTLAADEKGLRHIDFETARNPIGIDAGWKRDAAFFAPVKTQLKEYFNGERQSFDLVLAPVGTAFQQQVWEILQTIPFGAVASYRWVAQQLGNPKAVRAVGGANAKNPLPIVIPCHRVIGTNGRLTGFGGGLATKQRLLELENPSFAES